MKGACALLRNHFSWALPLLFFAAVPPAACAGKTAPHPPSYAIADYGDGGAVLFESSKFYARGALINNEGGAILVGGDYDWNLDGSTVIHLHPNGAVDGQYGSSGRTFVARLVGGVSSQVIALRDPPVS